MTPSTGAANLATGKGRAAPQRTVSGPCVIPTRLMHPRFGGQKMLPVRTEDGGPLLKRFPPSGEGRRSTSSFMWVPSAVDIYVTAS